MKAIKFFMTLILVSSVIFAAEAASVRLLITPPRDDGGYSLSMYIVEKMDTRIGTWVYVGETYAIKVEQNGKFVYAKVYYDVAGLTEGECYKFRVIARNPVGEGEPGSASEEYLARENLTKTISVVSGPGKSEGYSCLFEAPSANQALEREIAYRREEWFANLFFESV